MNEIIALIPARSGSKGVADKNIKQLGGHPLISWSIAACKKSKLINRIIVSTDSQIYADLAISLGAEVPFLRPLNISGDESADAYFIKHALNCLKISKEKVDYIAHVRPTSPLRNPKLIDEAISIFLKSKASSLRSVGEMAESAYKYFEIDKDGYLQTLSNTGISIDSANDVRQTFPLTFVPNGYIDVLSVKFINNTGLIHGSSVLPYVTPNITEVDTEDDFDYLEFQVEKNPLIINNLFI